MANLGAISYDVEVSTADMLRAEAVIDKSISGVVSDFDKADKAVREFEQTQKDLGRTINSMGQVLNKNGKVVASASVQYRKLAETATSSFNQLNTQVSHVAQSVNKGLNQALTNTSYQIQDIAVQLAGGQNFVLVLAQQLPQLLVGMGALAAGIGAVVAVLGGLYLAFGNSASNAEKLEKAVEQVQAVITVGADGVANYSEELEKLNKISDAIAQARLASAIQSQEKAIESAFKAASDTVEDFGKFYSDSAVAVADETGFTVQAISELNRALELKNVKLLEEGLNRLTSELQDATEDGQEFYQEFVKIASQLVIAQSDLDAINSKLKETGSTASQASNDISGLIQSLLLQREELQGGERAAFSLKLAMDGLTESERMAVLALYDTNQAIEQQKMSAEQSAKAIADVNSELESFFELESQRDEQRSAQQTATLTRQVQTIGLTPLEEIQSRYDQELELLRQAKEQGIEIVGTYADREKQIELEKSQAIQRLNEDSLGFLGDAFSNFEQQSAAALTSVVTGAQSGSDALKGLARTILTSVIQAIIQQGVAAAVASATASSAQVAANAAITASATPAATAVSLATAGANSGPAIAGITATSSITKSLLGASSIAGLREFGGPVTAGSMYRVGEKGKPEFFKDRLTGNLTMMPGQSGEVIPAEKMGMGGITVNVYGVPSELGQPEVTMDKVDRRIDLRFKSEAAKLRQGNGDFSKALKGGGNFQNNASR